MNKNDKALKGLTLKDPRVQKETFFKDGDRPGHSILICASCEHIIEIKDRDASVPVCTECKEHLWYKVSEY